MVKKASIQPFSFTLLIFFLLSLALSLHGAKAILNNDQEQYAAAAAAGSLVKRDQRRSLVATEYGEVSSIDVNDGHRKPYHLQFITLEPNSLFLPVLLHADMVFYVHTGSGRLSWADEDGIKRVAITGGDLYRLNPGSVFFVQSDLQTERQRLRIHAIFTTNTDDDLYDPEIGAYSSVRDLLRGFDPKVLRSAFKVSEEVIESITNGTNQSGIVHAAQTKKETFWDLEARFLKAFLGCEDCVPFNNKKKKTTTYNIFEEDPDFKNCNGWSLTVNKKDSHLLKGSNIGLFMVNLTKGSMMGPHWNPRATEISIVLQGQGMVRVVCSSTAKKSKCKNMRFRVHEGDVFAVPRFHPMAQMSFNNDSLVFMGFSTTTKNTHPQFLAGKYSVLGTLDKQVLAAAFNVTNTTVDQLLAAQADSVIIDCTSCAEEEEKMMLEEIEKEREEEEAKKREEARKREEEEEARKREEEEARKREEEARKREEEARKSEEEEARKREEEARKRREEEEEAARKREEEAERKREEEEQAARKREEEQEARQREEEQAARQREEERRKREEEGRQGGGGKGREGEERERQEQKECERREEDAQREQEEARRGRQPEQQGGGGSSIDAEEGRRSLSLLKV